jgi:hypothetical protein
VASGVTIPKAEKLQGELEQNRINGIANSKKHTSMGK